MIAHFRKLFGCGESDTGGCYVRAPLILVDLLVGIA